MKTGIGSQEHGLYEKEIQIMVNLSFEGKSPASEKLLEEARRIYGIYCTIRNKKEQAQATLETLKAREAELEKEWGRELDRDRFMDLSNQIEALKLQIEHTRIMANMDPAAEARKTPNNFNFYYQQASNEYNAFGQECQATLEALKAQYEKDARAISQLTLCDHPFKKAEELNYDMKI